VAFGALLAALAGFASSAPADLSGLTPRQKAALVVVSGLPAPPGVAGVIVRRWDRDERRPSGALVFADQEGGTVETFPELPPSRAASAYTSGAQAFAAGRATGRGLRSVGVDVDLAPVLDAGDGPLGSRHFRRAVYGVAFARGLEAAGVGACAKHFPGLGSAAVSTDDSPGVTARVRARELAGFRTAVRAGVPCVMVSHAFYASLGRARASLEPAAYRLLRRQGFRGVAITDSLNFVRSAPAERWAVRGVRAGADLLLFTDPSYARRAIRALLPLARRGELDAHVARVLRLREATRVRSSRTRSPSKTSTADACRPTRSRSVPGCSTRLGSRPTTSGAASDPRWWRRTPPRRRSAERSAGP
jgi:beta-glucosidase-like glycosyl hydrolase